MDCKKYRESIIDFIKVNKVSTYRCMLCALAQTERYADRTKRQAGWLNCLNLDVPSSFQANNVYVQYICGEKDTILWK